MLTSRSVLIFMILFQTSLTQTENQSQWLNIRPNSSEFINTLPFPNSLFKHKLRGKDTAGQFVLFEAEYMTDGPGRHIHKKEDELFHILDGQVQFYVDGKQFCGSTGDYVFVPRNIPQAIRVHNIHKRTKPVRIQIMLAPAGLEGFLDEIAPLYYTGQNNLTLQDEIAKKYGIINLDPVRWDDLGCFDNEKTNSKQAIQTNKPNTFFSSLISFVNNIYK